MDEGDITLQYNLYMLEMPKSMIDHSTKSCNFIELRSDVVNIIREDSHVIGIGYGSNLTIGGINFIST